GLDQPTAGTVIVGTTDVGALDAEALPVFRREHLGVVCQAANLLPPPTATQNILPPPELRGRRRDVAPRARLPAVAETPGIHRRPDHRPSELSGGQQQRVALARALITQPALLFADEPAGNLDSTTAAEVLDCLRQAVREFGQTAVMVTHDRDAARYADEVITMRDGRIA